MSAIDTASFFDTLATTMNADPQQYEVLGDVDMDIAVVMQRDGGDDFRVLLSFRGIACEGVSEIEAGDNRVDAAVSYDIPPGYVFTFDEQPGEEKLFVVFARQPVTDLEKLIYEVGRGRPGEPPAPKAGAEPKVLLAENRIEIGDQVVSELRNAYARDLIIEKVDETTKAPGYAKETAVYAVAPQGAADSRVVVDLSLIHR